MTAMTHGIGEGSYEQPALAHQHRRRRSARNTLPQAATNALAGASALTVTGTFLYALSALSGTVVAFDPGAAVGRFALLGLGLLTAGAIVWLNGATQEEGFAGVAAAAAAWIAAALGAYFLLNAVGQDSDSGRNAILGSLEVLIQSLPLPGVPGDVHANVMGGALIILIGLGAGGTLWLWQRQRLMAIATGLALCFACAMLVITVSRGAWFGLAVGTIVGVATGWRTGRGARRRLRYGADLLIGLLLGGLALGALALLFLPNSPDLLGVMNIGGSTLGRAELWHDFLPLIADYRFTGSGLTGTTEILSAYGLVLQVNFLTHAHNLYLQIAIEQGLPGLIGFLSLVGGTALTIWLTLRHGNTHQRPLALGALVALTALLVHGLMDAGVYVSILVPVVFLPFGVAWAAAHSLVKAHPLRLSSTSQRRRYRQALLLGVSTPLAFLALLFLWPGSHGALYANRGAVYQTKQELSVYVRPEWLVQDEIRRALADNLEEAVRLYSRALYIDGRNATANRRIGQLALAYNDVATAQRYLEQAQQTAPSAPATRRLLGEAYALNGERAEAVALWRSVPLFEGQLDARARWWKRMGDAAQYAALQAAVDAAEK